jgi:hypothetical protein
MKKESQWFKGLKYAEEIGRPSACEEMNRNEFIDNPAFCSGVQDYLKHCKTFIYAQITQISKESK